MDFVWLQTADIYAVMFSEDEEHVIQQHRPFSENVSFIPSIQSGQFLIYT